MSCPPTKTNCDSVPPPSMNPCSPSNINFGCEIYYYLGEYVNTSSTTRKLGQLDELYIAKENVANGWTIKDYRCDDLIDSGILPSLGSTNFFNKFTLSEKELLSTGTFETWKLYLSDWITSNSLPSEDAPFGIKVGLALKVSVSYLSDISDTMLKMIESFSKGDNSGVGSVGDKQLTIPREGLSNTDRAVFHKKLELCYDWFKNIHDSYYGKTFLIKIGSESPTGDSSGHNSFSGICVKDEKGDYPDTSLFDPIYYIKGDGSGQGFTVSDEVSSDGGFYTDPGLVIPGISSENILGLSYSDLGWNVSEDGKLDAFAKIGDISDADGNIASFTKFNENWYFDFTKLNPDNYFIKNIGKKNTLYIKINIEEKIYFTKDGGEESEIPGGQWALASLAEQVPLELLDNISYQAFDIFKVISILTHFKANKSGVNNYLDHYKFPQPSPLPFGARPSFSILNTLKISPVSLVPKGFAIPMKSNIYTYGPYYFDGSGIGGDNSGGIEVVKHEILCPWNFFRASDDNAISVATSFSRMDCVGSHLAKDAAKGLQQLEKGKISISGLPNFNLGYSVDTSSIFPDKDGPTVLTDINVDYGSNGFTTTYNFETYTPRFGRTSRHILDSWSDSIKQNNETNEYLRQERSRVSSLSKNLQKNISLENKNTTGLPTPIYTKKSTPNKLLISGYYLLSDGNFDDSVGANTNLFIPPINQGPNDCKESICNPPPPPTPANPSIFPNEDRLYTFSETHEAYQSAYIQNTYRQLCITSLDAIYLPVSLIGDPTVSNNPSTNTGRIPRFSMRTENNGSYIEWKDSEQVGSKSDGYPIPTKTRDEMPPFYVNGLPSKLYSLPIHQQYLNPYLSTKLMSYWDERKNSSEKGFVISSISFGDKFEKYQLTHNDSTDSRVDDETERQQQENFRFNALRGPLVLQAWGYDTTGKPIPNLADLPYKAERGQFRKEGLTDKFMRNWIENPRTWPVGPVDLRFDRERGVWTCPSPNKIVVARLKSRLNPGGSAVAELINPAAGGLSFYQNYVLSGPNGENVKQMLNHSLINVYDYLGVTLCACDIIYAYYDDNRYIVLESSRAYEGVELPEDCNIQCQPSTTTTTTTTTPTTPTTPPTEDCWCDLECLKTLVNYKPGTPQLLGHDGLCLVWYDMESCDPPPSFPPPSFPPPSDDPPPSDYPPPSDDPPPSDYPTPSEETPPPSEETPPPSEETLPEQEPAP